MSTTKIAILWCGDCSNIHAGSTATHKCHPVDEDNQRACKHLQRLYTYKWEYTPGIRVFSTELGKGESHRSGLHSPASSPHIFLDWLQAARPSRMWVRLGIGISLIKLPSTPWMGSDNGITASLSCTKFQITSICGRTCTYIRKAIGTGAYLDSVSIRLQWVMVGKTVTYKRNVSRQTASRYGSETKVS